MGGGNATVRVKNESSINANSATPVIGNPKLLKGHWCDEHYTKITSQKYKDKPRIGLLLKFNKASIDKRFKVKVYENDFGVLNEDLIYEGTTWIDITSEKMYWWLDPYSGDLFQKGGDGLQYLYAEVEIENANKVYVPSDSDDYLKVHIVTFIPGIMKALGWTYGEKIQKEWFKRAGSDKPRANKPILDFFTIAWVNGFSKAKAVYDQLIADKIWVNDAGKDALLKEIKAMGTTIPTTVGQITTFGTFSKSIHQIKSGTKVTEQIPIFDRFHFQERACNQSSWSTTDSDLDDLYATLANFVFRVCAAGTIEKKASTYLITVKQVGVYVRDSFDFVDDGFFSQPLGYWNPKTNKASTENKSGYYYVKNESYQDYRKLTKKGGDFVVFSELKQIAVSDSYEVVHAKL